jgi:hypothetical protein
MTDTWAESLREARAITGYVAAVPEHTVAAVVASLPPDQRSRFHEELTERSDGEEFGSFLDDWWVTAVEHNSDDRENAEEFAMLAVSIDRDKSPGKAYVHDADTDTWTEYRSGAAA